MRVGTTSTVSATAACAATPMRSWYAPRRSAARTSGSSFGISCFEHFASWKSRARRMRTAPYTSSVTSPRSRGLQGTAAEQLRHEDVRERSVLDAYQRVERELARARLRAHGLGLTASGSGRRAHRDRARGIDRQIDLLPAPPRLPLHAPAPLRLDLTQEQEAVVGDEPRLRQNRALRPGSPGPRSGRTP